jgi:virulence-associated protein VagC
MKIAVVCNSQLLQKSLEIFLEPHLTKMKNADIVLTDNKELECDADRLYISSEDDADIIKPFSKSQLFMAIDKLTKEQRDRRTINELSKSMLKDEEKEDVELKDFAILERRIDQITQEYKSNIITAIKAFYDEK